MPKHINSAYRAYTFLSAACARKDTEQMYQSFAAVLGISSPSTRKLIFEVQRSLNLFFDELEHAKEQLNLSGFSPDLYEGAFQTIASHIDASLIYNQWGGNQAVVKSQLHTLKFCSEVLPHEEELINEEELQAIKELLQKLDTQLKDSNLPDLAKAFIRHHISLIQKALSDYQIIGIKAFRDAVYEGYISYMRNEDVVNENENSEEFGLLSKAWKGVKNAADLAISDQKLLTAGNKLYELGGGVDE